MSKKYDRKSKEWVTEEEYNHRYSKKDKDLCRGGKPHDYILVLPSWGIKSDERYKFNPEPYYTAMDEIEKFIKYQAAILEERGILVRSSYGWGRTTRHYICSRCNKQEYGDKP